MASVVGGSRGALTAVAVVVSGWRAAGWLGSYLQASGVRSRVSGWVRVLLMLPVLMCRLDHRARKSHCVAMPGIPVCSRSGAAGNFALASSTAKRPCSLGQAASGRNSAKPLIRMPFDRATDRQIGLAGPALR
jgi:hypothetical protein